MRAHVGTGGGVHLSVGRHYGREAGGGQAVADLGLHQLRVGDCIVHARGADRRLVRARNTFRCAEQTLQSARYAGV